MVRRIKKALVVVTFTIGTIIWIGSSIFGGGQKAAPDKTRYPTGDPLTTLLASTI